MDTELEAVRFDFYWSISLPFLTQRQFDIRPRVDGDKLCRMPAGNFIILVLESHRLNR